MLLACLAPCPLFAADPLDSQIHSDVSEKVRSDHEQDVKSGKFASHSGRGPTSAQSVAGTSTVAGPPAAAHPTQVQELQKKKSTKPTTTTTKK
jgi:hypothetical protein